MSALDITQNSELVNCIETLTTTGRKDLDPNVLKNLKRICKMSDVNVEQAFHLIMHQLEKEHAEIRYSSFLIVDELFRRSHAFRELLVSDFQNFLELTVETDPDLPLPPPLTVAKSLKIKALQCIQEWYNIYGDGYKKLKLGFNFLKECKKVDFNDMEAHSVAERIRAERIEAHKQSLMIGKVQSVLEDMNEKQAEIEDCLNQAQNALQLLQPSCNDIFSAQDFSSPGTSQETKEFSEAPVQSTVANNSEERIQKTKFLKSSSNLNEENNSNEDPDIDADSKNISDDLVRQHGLGNMKYSLTVEVKQESQKLLINSDNAPIIESLKETLGLIRNLLTSVSKWTQVLTKAGNQSDKLKQCIDIKQAFERIISNCSKLNLSNLQDESKDDSDDDFEEVPEKNHYEENVVSPYLTASNSVKSVNLHEQPSCSYKKKIKIEDDPTTPDYNLKNLIKKNLLLVRAASSSTDISLPSTSKIKQETDPKNPKKAKLLSKAPKLRFDADLLRWDEKLEAPSVIKFDSLHRFWQPVENETNEIVQKDKVAALRTRKIDFSGKFEPVKWQCRAPLANGKLCPRYDRVKCPFHGSVIARDSLGNPTNPEDIERLKKEEEIKKQNEPPEWQDPELLKEIEAATGVDLTVAKGKRKKKYPGLTDIKKVQDTTRKRLENKVFHKSSMKRVAADLDDLDYKKYIDKFGDQFNYSYKT